jgi:NTP pyrophosphatase (non-canonical NTP hydrolase)
VTSLEQRHQLISEFDLGRDPSARALDLSSEVGEVCKEILKGTDYGTQDFQKTTNLETELGDVYLSLLALAVSTNVDLEIALEKSVQKMRDRLDRTGQIGSKS